MTGLRDTSGRNRARLDRAFYCVWWFISHGPCCVCGRRWFLGWTATNLMGVCSWRCARDLNYTTRESH